MWRSADPLKDLVVLMAAERHPHQVVARVAADVRLLQEAGRLYHRHQELRWAERKRLLRLCRRHQVSLACFHHYLRMIAHTLDLTDGGTDYYELLGVDRRARPVEIKRAFRRQIQIWHPDRKPGDERAAARFQQLCRAYRVLSTDHERQRYDRRRLAVTKVGAWPSGRTQATHRSRGWRRRFLWTTGFGFTLLLLLSAWKCWTYIAIYFRG
jgi:hypothetical protein